jgi:CHAT domain-containing protein/Tfp pilus assembly protein PilF
MTLAPNLERTRATDDGKVHALDGRVIGSDQGRAQIGMVRSLTKLPFVLFALGLLIFASSPSLGKDDNLNQRKALDGQISKLFAERKFQEAIPLAEKLVALTKRAKGDEDPDTAGSLRTLAVLYDNLRDFAKAEPLLKEALAIHQKVLGPEHPYTAESLYDLGKMYEDMADFGKTELMYKESLAIYENFAARQHGNSATAMQTAAMKAIALNRLAYFYLVMGDVVKAEPMLKESLEIEQKVFGRENPATVTILVEMAGVYEHLHDYAKAEALYKEALESDQKVLGRKNRNTAAVLDLLGLLYTVTGDYPKAEPLYKEALEIDREVLGRENPNLRNPLANLGSLYWRMGEYAKAEPLLKEALEICQKGLGPEQPETAAAMERLAHVELESGEIQEARLFSQSEYDINLKAFSKILLFGSEDQRLAYERNHIPDPYSLFAELDEPDAMAGAVLHYQGVVLDSVIEERLLAETTKQEANRDLIEELSAKRRILAQLSLQTTAASPKEVSERIQTLEQEVEDIEDKLARQGTDIGQARRSTTFTVEQVQAAIPNDAVLVEYVCYDRSLGKHKSEPSYGAIVLSAAAPPRWVALGSAKEIEATLNRYQRLVREAGDDEMTATLQKLYNEMWEPVEHAFPAHTNRVIISPDGQLNFLSFATLLNPEKGFVAEKYSIQYVTSGRDLLREPKSTQNKQVIVMANPKFDRDIQLASSDLPSEGAGILRGAEKRDVEDLSFVELAGTQKESAQLLLIFKDWGLQASSLTGPEATKRALLDLHGPYILHLATHGFFEPDDSSSDANSNESQSPGTDSEFAKSRFFKNPMHRSGLALTGANSTIAAWKRGEAPPIEEDGILTAEDVSTLDLKGTWLVTLSACDTGSGEARAGEGVMGLRRGFVEAGTRNLLMTLWPISDEVTVQIMSDFYEAAHKTGNAPEALAEVQRNWLVKLRTEKGLAEAVSLAGPFIMSSQGRP